MRPMKIKEKRKLIDWNNIDSQKQFLDDISIKFNIKTKQDWNKITRKDLIKNGGTALLSKYNNNITKLLEINYPDEKWNVLSRDILPRSFWDSIENQKLFFQNIQEKYQLKSLNELHNINTKLIINEGGSGLLKKYKGSFFTALKTIYPNEEWNFFQLTTKPKYFWDSPENQKNFLHYLYKKFKLNSMEEWYYIRVATVEANGGAALLKKYRGSLFDALKENFPNFHWDILKTKSKRKLNKNEDENLMKIQRFFEIKKKKDWYRISLTLLNDCLRSDSQKTISLFKLLKKKYLNEEWKRNLFIKGKRSSQWWLLIILSRLFPQYKLIEDYFHPLIRFRSEIFVSFDIFIPSLNTALEFNGEQHFEDLIGKFGSNEVYRDRDIEKRNLCIENSINLISIPYWWDRSIHSLKLTLLRQLPFLNF